MMAVRARDARSDLRAAVTAVLPVVAAGYADSREALGEALRAAGLGDGSDRDLALIAGAVESARAFVLIGECLESDPSDVWTAYLQQSA